MKLSVLNLKQSRYFNPDDSYRVLNLTSLVSPIDHDIQVTQAKQFKADKGILTIEKELYIPQRHLNYLSGLVLPASASTAGWTINVPMYMLVGEDDLKDVESEMMVGKWAGIVLNNLDSNMLERDYPRKLVKSLISIGKTVFIMGLQYPRQALWIHRQYNGKVAGVFSSLPVVYGRMGIALHPQVNPMFDLPENEAADNSSGYYNAMIHWNVRCMEAWAQGVELIPPGWLQ